MIMLIIFALVITPIVATSHQEELLDEDEAPTREEIKAKIEEASIDAELTKRIKFILPITMKLTLTDSDEEPFVFGLFADGLTIIENPKKIDLAITGTTEQTMDAFDEDTEDTGKALTTFSFKTQSFKGSVLAIGLEAAYNTVLIEDPTFSQKVLKWVVNRFV